MGLHKSERRVVGKAAGKVKSVADFLSESLDAFEGSHFAEAIASVTPWASILGTAAEESLAPVKFIMKVIEGATRIDDPSELALLACTVSYQRSIQQTLREFGPPPFPRTPPREDRLRLRQLGDEMTPRDFEAFNLSNAASHPFVAAADRVLAHYLETIGYSEDSRTQIIGDIHDRFLPTLLDLMSHRDTAEKFEPLVGRDRIDGDRIAARAALAEHHRLLRWQFHRKPVLGRERFALADIYIRPEGGLHRGREAAPKRRSDLGELVFNFLVDPDFRDPILIEAPAGAGKSAFTSWLAADLLRQGLKPIRIQLRDVPFDTKDVLQALGRAVPVMEDHYNPVLSPGLMPLNVFGDGQMFRESVFFRKTKLCPYVLILDGWDEVSISVSAGFRERLHGLMEGVRNMFLRFRYFPFRVILTGRPTQEMYDSSIFGSTTPVIHVSALSPEMLELLARRVATFSQRPPISHEERADLLDWPPVIEDHFTRVIQQYRHSVIDNAEHIDDTGARDGSHFEVLGLPLLAYLALRTISEPGVDAEAVLHDPTTLYRQLIDLTADKAGKAADSKEAIDGLHRVSGETLRDLIQRTAAAITVLGEESISRRELQERLSCTEAELERKTTAVDDNTFSKLIVSYYFRGGKSDLGCEFLHKSFREYLFAEHIVTILKRFPQTVRWELHKRRPYWKDFERVDPRFAFSRELTMLLAPQWLSGEVATHVSRLLEWEISRSPISHTSATRRVADAIGLDEWERIRDVLADLWDWWGEGVHLRVQPELRGDSEHPLLQNLMRWTQRFDLAVGARIDPVRSVTIDAHLGDALFHICANIHYFVARRRGWFDGESATPNGSAYWWRNRSRHDYQTRIGSGEQQWTLFAPGGERGMYWDNYVARINAAGWRRAGRFPSGADLRGVDLEGAVLVLSHGPALTIMDSANLANARVIADLPIQCRLDSAHAPRATFEGCDLSGSSFHRAALLQSSFARCRINGVAFTSADLTAASFVRTVVLETTFEDATLDETKFDDADLQKVTFDRAAFRKTSFDRATLLAATFASASWHRIEIEGRRGTQKETVLTSTFDHASIAKVDFAKTLEQDEITQATLDFETIATLRSKEIRP